MPEQRNPYATTNVPLEVQAGAQTPGEFDTSSVEYSTFWRRVGAVTLDGLIKLPLSLPIYVGLYYTRLVYLFWLAPSLIITAWYAIYLVMRNGGTPGKRIVDLRIVMLDGAPVTAKAAILRYAVQLSIAVLATLGLALAGLNISDADFQSLNYLQKLTALTTHAPAWNTAVTRFAIGWYLLVAILMLCNSKRRAVHDFIAGTVVIRTN
jgi:uncharacterized RDD family membrane protein YckC